MKLSRANIRNGLITLGVLVALLAVLLTPDFFKVPVNPISPLRQKVSTESKHPENLHKVSETTTAIVVDTFRKLYNNH